MQRLVPLVVLLAALAAAVAGQNSCEVASGACLAPPASLAASLLPVLPEARRRNYVPPVPQGPDTATATDAVLSPVDLDLPVHIIVRGNVGSRLADAAAVQGVAPAVVLPADAQLGSQVVADAVQPLALTTNNSIVLFLDDPELTLLLGEVKEISRKFQRSGARILLSASQVCHKGCAFNWPEVPEGYPQYVDTNAFIGYAGDVAAMLGRIPPPSGSVAISDHHHIAAFFLNAVDRSELGMQLDSAGHVFASLGGYDDNMDLDLMEIVFEYNGAKDTRLQLKFSNATPAIVLGRHNPKLLLQINNYAPMRWHPDLGCLHCRNATQGDVSAASVFIGIIVQNTAPFLDLMLQSTANQTFDKSRTTIGIVMRDGPSLQRYDAIVADFLANHTEGFKSASVLGTKLSPLESYRMIFSAANASGATHVLLLESYAHLLNPDALTHLLLEDKPVLAPMLTRASTAFSNIWGAADGDKDTQCRDTDTSCAEYSANDGCNTHEEWMNRHCPVSCGRCVGRSTNFEDFAYRRSFDYMSWATGERRGLWEVPYVGMAVLYRADAASLVGAFLNATLDNIAEDQHLPKTAFDLSVLITWHLRDNKVPLVTDNLFDFGLLSSVEGYRHEKVHPDIFLVTENEPLWRRKYLHPSYEARKKLEFVQGRCWDIYNFPLFTEAFCSSLVAEAENFGQWSGGTYNDKRLKGGYEPVPTRDIHFKQMGFDKAWYAILKNYVAPVVETQWIGYHLEGRETLDFIVKYEPNGQPFLRPHHDASTFSLNVALNRIGVDFEGGGTRFHRQNCTVLTNEMGYALAHPGRLTHQHEGLYVTKGTRYIIVSFVDQV